MFYKNQRILKKRSTIKRTTQSPVYNERFTFNIPDNDIENIHFDIVLFDYDRHMKHEPIGTFSIGNNTDEINHHWNDVCHRQITKQIAQWYQLKPFNLLSY
jgi:Ca2+-dependent lipid-binding protein